MVSSRSGLVDSTTAEQPISSSKRRTYLIACAGWREKTAQARSWVDLPAQAIKYVRRLEELIGCSAAVLSTSPEREDTILMQNPFEM